MKDPEFYTVSEDWPQPPDEPCTLRAAPKPTATAAAPKKKSKTRIRKKMSESLAGITAAAVAVVMVASALPTMKDIFEEEFLGDLIPDSTVMESKPVESKPTVETVGKRCPICGELDCPYYSVHNGLEGLRLTYDGEPEYLEYDLYAMNGFNKQDQDTAQRAAAINTETDARLALRISEAVNDLLMGSRTWSPLTDNLYVWGDVVGVSGFEVYFEDDASADVEHVLYVYLAYSPGGEFPADTIAEDLDIQEETAALHFTSSGVAGVENAELHVYSDLGEEFNQAVLECCIVDVITEPDCSFTLGQTMQLQEGTVVHRTFEDELLWKACYYVPVSQEKGELWAFEANFYYKTYAINDMTITFAATSWLDLFEQWWDLSDLAPKYMHQTCFPIYYLGETAANGITYRCYATYVADDSEDYYVTYLVVPKQEQEILISFTEYFSAEEIAALQSGQLDAKDIADTYEIFSQITLR